MANDYRSGDLTDVLIYPETTMGYGPVQDGSDWATALSGGAAYRFRVTGISVATARRGVIPNPDMSIRHTESHKAIQGVRRGGDVQFTTQGYGSEAATGAASQIAETALMKLHEWALGGLSRNNKTTVASVTTDVTWVITAATNYAKGQLCILEDVGDPNRGHVRRIQSLSGTDVTTHADIPGWNLAGSDAVHPMATAYFTGEAQTTGGAGHKTLSILVIKNGTCAEFRACKLVLDQVAWANNAPILCTWRAIVGRAVPIGDAPAAPTLTVDPEGISSTPQGVDTYMHYQDRGTTAHNAVHLLGGVFRPGYTPEIHASATAENQYVDGMAGYYCGRASPMFEATVFLDTDHYDDFKAQTDKVLTVYSTVAAGNSYALHCPNAYIMDFEPLIEGRKEYKLQLQLREDTVITDTDLGRSPFLLGIG